MNFNQHGENVDGPNIFGINNDTESRKPIFGMHPDVGAVPTTVDHGLADIPPVETINAPWVQPFLSSFDTVNDHTLTTINRMPNV
jgi:hypothetical protein